MEEVKSLMNRFLHEFLDLKPAINLQCKYHFTVGPTILHWASKLKQINKLGLGRLAFSDEEFDF
jgi:hypothetical protein